MSQAKTSDNVDILLNELNLLKAYSKVYSTIEGAAVINDILNLCEMNVDPWVNNGQCAHNLGKQTVARMIIGRLIEADVNINAGIFSKKSSNKKNVLVAEINEEINKNGRS